MIIFIYFLDNGHLFGIAVLEIKSSIAQWLITWFRIIWRFEAPVLSVKINFDFNPWINKYIHIKQRDVITK